MASISSELTVLTSNQLVQLEAAFKGLITDEAIRQKAVKVLKSERSLIRAIDGAITAQIQASQQRSLQGNVSRTETGDSDSIDDGDEIKRLKLALLLFQVSKGCTEIVTLIAEDLDVVTLQDFVTTFYSSLENEKKLPLSLDQKKAIKIDLYDSEPTAVLYVLIGSHKISIPSEISRKSVKIVFDHLFDRDFNIRKDKLGDLSDAEIPEEQRENVAEYVRTLQRLLVLVESPEDLTYFLKLKKGFASAKSIAETHPPNYLEIMRGVGMEDSKAQAIHDRATIVTIRNEQTWAAMLKMRTEFVPSAVRPSPSTVLPISTSDTSIDQGSRAAQKLEPSQKVAIPQSQDLKGNESLHLEKKTLQDNKAEVITYLQIFREAETAYCTACTSVFSLSAYFVDLMRRLEFVTFESGESLSVNLLIRRPDLADLQLSCANTNTPIPYIDIVTEILESFITQTLLKKREKPAITAFNEPETKPCDGLFTASSMMPGNVDYNVYKEIAKVKVFPMEIFPYNHAVDTMRALLTAKGSSWYEFLTTLWPNQLQAGINWNEAAASAGAAEYLGLSYEDFVAVTSEGYESLQSRRACSNRGEDFAICKSAYEKDIGLHTVADYWGYKDTVEMLDMSSGLGLSNIRNQLLPRSGLTFADLLAILKTQYIAGRLAITSLEGYKTFSGRLDDMVLRTSGLLSQTGELTVDICSELQSFIRLRSKSGLSTTTLDAALSCLSRRSEFTVRTITPNTIRELASIKELSELVKVSVIELLPLWGNIDTNGDDSLYSRLFLQRDTGLKAQSRFKASNKKAYLSVADAPSISASKDFLMATLNISPEAFDMIQNSGGLKDNDQLSISRVSFFYRTSLVSTLLGVTGQDFVYCYKTRSSLDKIFEAPEATLKVVSSWLQLKAAGWNITDLKICTGMKDSLTYQEMAFEAMINIANYASLHSKVSNESDTSLEAQQLVSNPSLAEPIYNVIKAKFPSLNAEVFRCITNVPLIESGNDRVSIIKAFEAAIYNPPGKTVDEYLMTPSLAKGVSSFAIDSPHSSKPTLNINGSEVLLSFDNVQKLWKGFEMVPKGIYFFKSNCNRSTLYTTQTGSRELLAAQFCFDKGVSTSLIKAYTILDNLNTLARKLKLREEEFCDLLSLSGSSIVAKFDAYTLSPLQLSELQNYTSLRDSLPVKFTGFHSFLLEIKALEVNNTVDHQVVAEALSRNTGWDRISVLEVLGGRSSAAAEVDLTQGKVYNTVQGLYYIQKVIKYAKSLGLEGISIKQMFTWSNSFRSRITLDAQFEHAADLRQCLVSKTRLLPGSSQKGQTSLDTAFDALREHRRAVLTLYLLNDPYFIKLKFTDTDHLFEYFLIDVNMGSGLQTSRMKQAVSTIQLFVQRCFLGLEKGFVIRASIAESFRKEWSYLGKYTLWEANRKVFLYPENWVDPTLRDNKTDLFKEVESRISQNGATVEIINDAIRGYIYGVNEIANLDVQAYLWEKSDKGGRFHFFARTRTSPYVFYYRQMRIIEFGDRFPRWDPWTKLDLNIVPRAMDNGGGSSGIPGNYLIPVIVKGRLYLFLPELNIKTVVISSDRDNSVFEIMQDQSMVKTEKITQRNWEIKMTWSEYRNGKWSKKMTSTSCLEVKEDPQTRYLPLMSEFQFRVKSRAADSKLGTEASVEATYGNGIDGVLVIEVNSYREENNAHVTKSHGHFEMVGMNLEVFHLSDIKKIGTLAAPAAPGTFSSVPAPIKTLPTHFAKLPWTRSTKDKKKTVPDYEVTNSTAEQSALLAETNVSDATKLSWTISINDSQYPRPTGFIVDLQTSSGGNISYFIWPTANITSTTKSESTRQDSMVSRFDFPSCGALVDLASAGVEPEVLYKALNEAYLYKDNNCNETDKPNRPEEYSSIFGLYMNKVYHEQFSPYSLYTWELGVHLISLLMEHFKSTQQYDLALRFTRLTFDPTVVGKKLNRCWLFAPFQDSEQIGIQSIEELLKSLESTTDGSRTLLDMAVLDWRENPFNPHGIARARPIAYMKRIVMKYIEILIDAGDYYFRQNTLESIPLALQRYIEASHVFGSAQVKLPKLVGAKSQSYKQMQSSLNAFSNSSLDLELEFPFSARPYKAVSNSIASKKPGLIGILQSTYFCVPSNPENARLRELIDDRLFKIRNCQDINGKTQRLPLFDPPIDPGALVAAQSRGGLAASALLADADSPMPNYRFNWLLQRAFDLCNELKGMESSFISVKEKKDSEGLANLRARQDIAIQSISGEVKKLQIQEAKSAIDALYDTRRSHVSRLNYYLALMGEKRAAPGYKDEWIDIEQSYSKITKCDLRMTNNEEWEMDLADVATGLTFVSSVANAGAGILKLVPEITVNTAPLGVGVAVKFDTSNIAKSMKAYSSSVNCLSQLASSQSSRAGRKAQLIRQLQERRFQANAAGRDIKNIDLQIEAQKIRITAMEKEAEQQALAIKHVIETEEWLKTKYTNEQLYTWQENTIKTSFYETYRLVSELARKVEKTFVFERGSRSTFLRSTGYWDSARDGISAAQNLYLDLKRMEMAHMELPSYDFELLKNISLRQIDPLALMKLRTTGRATFDLPETLFDMDFPGHYMRRIKGLAVNIPAICGSYTSFNCIVTITSHKYRVSETVSDSGYEEQSSSDARFKTEVIPTKCIALSSGQNDSGVFDMNFRDERYMPFEGAGTISSWNIEFPSTIRQFDYDGISDVIFQLRYTSRDGSEALRKAAKDNLLKSVGGGRVSSSLIDIKSEITGAWRLPVNESETGSTTKVLLKHSALLSRLPFWAHGKAADKVVTVKAVSLLSEASFATALLKTGDGATDLGKLVDAGTGFGIGKDIMKVFRVSELTEVLNEKGEGIEGQWLLEVSKEQCKDLQKAFVLLEYFVTGLLSTR